MKNIRIFRFFRFFRTEFAKHASAQLTLEANKIKYEYITGG